MMKIKQSTKGFPKAEAYLKKARRVADRIDLDRLGQNGVAALQRATPVDSGKTQDSWSYTIVKTSKRIGLAFTNSNKNNGVPVVILLEYGHIANGAWVEGRDFVNPAIQPIFDELAEELQKGVTGK